MTRTPDTERADAVAFIRRRAAYARTLAGKQSVTAAEANQLSRWLGTLADDLSAGIHEGEETP